MKWRKINAVSVNLVFGIFKLVDVLTKKKFVFCKRRK